MTDRDALLRAICESPEDEAPRLVYADWLDENGDPRQAEFIRVQIELAHGPTSAQRTEKVLWKREVELLPGTKKWRFLPLNWISLTQTDFDRGFCKKWDGPIESFLFVAPNYCRHGPLETLRLSFDSDRTPKHSEAPRIAASPVLGCLNELALSGKQLDDRWAIALVTSPFAARWRVLTLSGEELSDAVCEGLASSPLVKSECRLSLRSNSITRRGTELLERVFGSRQQVREIEVRAAADDDDHYDGDME